MSLIERVLWGLLAGLAIVLVKILVPDQQHVESLFVGGTAANIAFYVFISAITILLGAISGAFSNERDRIKLMLFCASVPGLLSTATAVKRDPVVPKASDTAPIADLHVPTLPSVSFIITPAFAQADDQFVCIEGGFIEQFSQSAQNYLTGIKQTDIPQYSVVVWSTANLDEAKRVADRLAAAPGDWQPSVGCRRPDNEYYPVTIGTMATEVGAAELLGRFVEANLLSEPPYLSNYPYRTTIYTPPS